MTGQTISHFKILQKLGDGGMGVVYKAEDTNLKRIVALKLLPMELTSDPESKERLLREAQAGSAFQHQNICTIHEIGETEDGQMYICMDYYEGKTLKERLDEVEEKSTQTMPVSEALDISIQIAHGLSKAHEIGIIHRDIKPANIIITGEGVVKILDFGLARLFGKSKITQTGKTIGTIAYLSPEQAEGKTVDHRTDVWSFGVVLYEMCTSKLPFENEYDAAVIYAILDKTPILPSELCSDISKGLEQIILKCLEKNPNDRYQNIDELLSDLNRIKVELNEKNEISGVKEKKTKSRRIFRKSYLKKKWILILTGIIIILFVGYILLPHIFKKHPSIESIAILPFENLSNDKEQEYFVSGMHEELLTDLTKIKALRVISRTSVMQYRKINKSATEIAKELNVDALVEGSVLKAGDRVRISVQLIDGKTDKHIWAESYDRNLQNVISMLSDVSLAIAQEIAVEITQQEKNQLAVTHPINSEVHQEYLKGRYLLNQLTYQGIQDALIHFKKSTEIDTEFASGYAGQASIYFVQGFFGFKPYTEVFPIARFMAMKALQIDEGLAEAHSVMGWIKLCYDWDWQGAAKELERALELNPNDVIARHAYGDYLTVMGHPEEGLKQINLSRKYDPFSPMAVIPSIYHLAFVHRYDEMIEESRKLLAKDPNYPSAHGILQEALWLKGNYKESYQEYLKTWSWNLSLKEALERGYKFAGPKGALIELARTLAKISKPQTGASLTIATLYAMVNEKELALEWLEKAYQEHAPFLVHLKANPVFDFIHLDPRFHSLLQKIGFPETEKD